MKAPVAAEDLSVAVRFTLPPEKGDKLIDRKHMEELVRLLHEEAKLFRNIVELFGYAVTWLKLAAFLVEPQPIIQNSNITHSSSIVYHKVYYKMVLILAETQKENSKRR